MFPVLGRPCLQINSYPLIEESYGFMIQNLEVIIISIGLIIDQIDFEKKKYFVNRFYTILIIYTYQKMESGIARKRVQNQRKSIQQNPPVNWKIIPHSQKWNIWDVWITTQLNTPYHSIPFLLIVQFPENYPQEKPKLKLDKRQRFFHPNISAITGTICEETIKSTKICTTIRERIDAFVTLLEVPNALSPLNEVAADLYKDSPQKFYKKAFHVFRGYTKMP